MFTPDDVWYGGFFELSIELGDRCDERINDAVQALWTSSRLTGCYIDRCMNPDMQVRIKPPLVTEEDWCHVFGIADFNGPDLKLACGSCVVRETGGPDWLDFYFPLGSLDRVFPVGGFPFLDQNERVPWSPRVEIWLAELGLELSKRIPMRMGLIGFDCSGSTELKTFTQDGGIPSERWIGYIWPSDGVFTYLPSNASKT